MNKNIKVLTLLYTILWLYRQEFKEGRRTPQKTCTATFLPSYKPLKMKKMVGTDEEARTKLEAKFFR